MSTVIRLRYGRPENRGSIPERDKRYFCSPNRPDRIWGQSALYSMGTRFSPPGSKAYHSPPSSAKVKNAWIYTSTPAYIFTACTETISHLPSIYSLPTMFKAFMYKIQECPSIKDIYRAAPVIA